MSKRKKGLALVGLLLLSLGLVYGAGVVLFQRYTYPMTYLGGDQLSFLALESLPELVEDQELLVQGRDGEQVRFKARDLGMVEEFEALDQVQEDALAWPWQVFQEHDLDAHLQRSVDDQALKEGLAASDLFKDRVAPVDAEIVLTDESLHIEDEVLGNTLDPQALEARVKEAFLGGESQIQLDQEYVQPQVLAQDLQPRIEHLEDMLEVQLTLAVSDQKEEVPKLPRFLDDNLEINLDKVKDYVMEIKNKYDNVGKERDFKTSLGSTIKVSGGIFGVKVNRDQTAAKLVAAFESEESQEVQAEYTRQALNHGEIGGDYIELSIEKQTMWLYRDGNLVVETPVVTGNLSQGYRTPPGVWEVWVKETNRRLRGKNRDGTEYDVPVKYWMQVDYTGIGIHDTYYRSAYGGQIYRWDGSHGCINTPLNKVSQIFENTPMGTPMVIY